MHNYRHTLSRCIWIQTYFFIRCENLYSASSRMATKGAIYVHAKIVYNRPTILHTVIMYL